MEQVQCAGAQPFVWVVTVEPRHQSERNGGMANKSKSSSSSPQSQRCNKCKSSTVNANRN